MLKLFKLVARVLFAAIIVFVGLPVNASPNLITNGDFATGDTTGWTLTGDTSFTSVMTGGTPPQQNFLNAGPLSNAQLSQSFSTDAGQAYLISFDLQAEPGTETGTITNAFFSANFDGVGNIFSTTAQSFSWMTFTFTETALLTGSSTLSFDYVNVPSFYDLTNVSVSAVPEPEIYAMMGVGLLLMGFVVHRRRH